MVVGSYVLRASQGCGMHPFVSYAFYGAFVKYGGVDSQGKHRNGKEGVLSRAALLPIKKKELTQKYPQ